MQTNLPVLSQTENPPDFHYEDIWINHVYWINKKPYFTCQAIGNWLGKSQEEIRDVTNRNPYINNDCFATPFGDGWIYNPIRLFYIVYNCRKLRHACDFKIMAANLVGAFMRRKLKAPDHSPAAFKEQIRQKVVARLEAAV